MGSCFTGGCNRGRKCCILRVSPPLRFVVRLRLQKEGAYLRDATVYCVSAVLTSLTAKTKLWLQSSCGYWGEPERAPHRRYSWEISYIIIIITIMVRPSPARRGWSHEVCRASMTPRGSRYTARKVLYCQTVSVLVLLL